MTHDASSLCSTSAVILHCQMGQKCPESPESLLKGKLSETFGGGGRCEYPISLCSVLVMSLKRGY